MGGGVSKAVRGFMAVTAGALFAIFLATSACNRASAQPQAGAPPATPTSTTLPSVPPVSLSLTAGVPPAQLLARAVNLSSFGSTDPKALAELQSVQSQLERDETAAVQAREGSQAAAMAAAQAQAQAQQAGDRYQDMRAALQRAVISLYVSGPPTLNPRAPAALYADDYLASSLTPYGVIAEARQTQAERETALGRALDDQRRADADAARAQQLLASMQAEQSRLQATLEDVSQSTASDVEQDHAILASQASENLLSPDTSLQFTPKQAVPAPLPTTNVALAWAFAELGQPYQWGGTGPNSFDCSGLTQFVWEAAGVSIPRVAADQYSWTVPVPLSDLLPGDLVFFGTTDIHHVGIYIGDGLTINAPHTGTDVQVSTIWWSDLAGFGRVHSPTTPVPPRATPTPNRAATPAVVPSAGLVPSQVAPSAAEGPAGTTTTTTTVRADPTTTVVPESGTPTDSVPVDPEDTTTTSTTTPGM